MQRIAASDLLACRRGVEVPFRIESLVKDEKAAQAFAEKARGQLQR